MEVLQVIIVIIQAIPFVGLSCPGIETYAGDNLVEDQLDLSAEKFITSEVMISVEDSKHIVSLSKVYPCTSVAVVDFIP